MGDFNINSPRLVDNSVFLVKDVVNPTLKEDHQKIRSLASQEEHDAIALIPILVEEKEDVLVNCDMAFRPMSSKEAITILIRDGRSSLVDGMAREVALSSATQGEALAIWLACHMVSSLGLSSVEVEGDNNRVIH
ncbi:hypothetical protein LOK49_Contig290G00004 [Camellia lanceoleosa]|nr:hypothetical protein LOK49_Contig290G00004 [Camellia lanceoleosa]